MSEGQETGQFQEWCLVELMGHRRLAGRVTEVELFGARQLRLDVPDRDGWVTQFYGGGAIYCVTPVSEEIARSIAARSRPEPVHRWELPEPDEPEPADAEVEREPEPPFNEGDTRDIPRTPLYPTD